MINVTIFVVELLIVLVIYLIARKRKCFYCGSKMDNNYCDNCDGDSIDFL